MENRDKTINLKKEKTVMNKVVQIIKSGNRFNEINSHLKLVIVLVKKLLTMVWL